MDLLRFIIAGSFGALLIDIAVVFFGWRLYKLRKTKPIGKKWYNNIYRNEVHTTPLDDVVEHTPEDCACSPKTIPVPLDDGTVNWQVIHNAMDGRPND